MASVSEQDLDDIYPVMAILEARCARLTATRASDDDLRRLAEIHDELECHAAGNDVDAFFEANQNFHNLVEELAGNRWLAQLIQETRKILKLVRRDSLNLDGRVRQSLLEHRAILAALQARDTDAADRLMHDHLLSGRAALNQLHTVR